MTPTRGRARRAGAIEGFTLVEMLVSAFITLALAGLVFAFVAPAQRMFRAQPEQSDLQQRLRVSVDTIGRDLLMAGAGTYAGPADGPLVYTMAPLLPYRAFGDAPDPAQGVFFRDDAISFVYVPATPSQTRLAGPLAPGALDVQLDLPPNCPAGTSTQVCGFDPGDRLLIVDRQSQWDVFAVDRIAAAGLTLRRRGLSAASAYETDATVTEVRLGTYYLKTDDAARLHQLMRHDGWSTDLPVVDDVVDLAFEYFGDPEPPRLTGTPLDEMPGPWTTYGPAPPPIDGVDTGWPSGENCVFVLVDGQHAPRLPVLGAGPTLVALTPDLLTDGPWCPNALSPNRFDADLLRVRKVRATLRVQAAPASLRGPAGALFRKGGLARAAEHFVPDIEVQFDITPRNLNLGR